MSAAIYMNRVCGNIETRDLVIKHGGVPLEMVPVLLSNTITRLAASKTSKVEGSMDDCVRM
jgi:hypothetical protein